MSKFLPLAFVVIAFVFGISYLHESEVMTKIQDEIQSGMAAPQKDPVPTQKSEIPL